MSIYTLLISLKNENMVKSLHFNAKISGEIAKKLCYILMEKGTEPKRCSKEKMKLILQYQKSLGCKATETTDDSCACELL